MKPDQYALYFASVMLVAIAAGCMDRVDIVGGVVQQPPVAEYLVPSEYNLKGISADGRNLVFFRKQESNAVICNALTGRELLDCSGGNHWIDRDMLFLDRMVGGREVQAIRLSGEAPKVLWKKRRGLGGYGPGIGPPDGIAIGQILYDRYTGKAIAKQHWPDSYTESFSGDGKLSAIASVVGESGNTEPSISSILSSIPKPFGKKVRVSLWDHQKEKLCWEKEFSLPYLGSIACARLDRLGEYMIVSVGLRPPIPPGYKGPMAWKRYSLLLRCKDGALVKEFELGCSARWTADGRGLLTGHHGGRTRYRRKKTGRAIADFDSAVSSASGVIAGSERLNVHPLRWQLTIWNTRTGAQIRKVKSPGTARNCISISDNGRYLHAGTIVEKKGCASVFDLSDGREVIRLHGVPNRRTKNRSYMVQIADNGTLAIQWGRTVRVYKLGESRVTQH